MPLIFSYGVFEIFSYENMSTFFILPLRVLTWHLELQPDTFTTLGCTALPFTTSVPVTPLHAAQASGCSQRQALVTKP